MDRPFRLRSKDYLFTVRGQPCLICGEVSSAHHLTFIQARAMSLKTGDQYCVPLCHAHHMKLHESGLGEKTWWATQGINPVVWANLNYAKWLKVRAEENGKPDVGVECDEHYSNEPD